MEEQQKAKPHELQVEIKLKRLSGKALEVDAKPLMVEFRDISRTGIKFFTGEILKLGSFYDAKITLWTSETVQSLFEIVRIMPEEDGYVYHCIFVGMPEEEVSRIDVYELFKEAEDME